jgi:hypothetical protein
MPPLSPLRCGAHRAHLASDAVAGVRGPTGLDRAHLEAPDTLTAFGEPPIRIDLLSELSG